jgi:hypothetical protein
LPAGFRKVRHFGFLSPRSGIVLEAVRLLVTVLNGTIFTRKAESAAGPAVTTAPRCPVCGGPMCVLGFAPAPVPAAFDTS